MRKWNKWKINNEMYIKNVQYSAHICLVCWFWHPTYGINNMIFFSFIFLSLSRIPLRINRRLRYLWIADTYTSEELYVLIVENHFDYMRLIRNICACIIKYFLIFYFQYLFMQMIFVKIWWFIIGWSSMNQGFS